MGRRPCLRRKAESRPEWEPQPFRSALGFAPPAANCSNTRDEPFRSGRVRPGRAGRSSTVEATIDKLEHVAGEAAGKGAELVVFPETFVPVYPSSLWAKAFAGWQVDGAKETFARIAQNSVAVGSPAERRLGAARAGARHLARHRRQRGRARAAGHDLQLAPLPLARRRARAPPPQARADEPRAARLGAGRRPRAARGRDRLRPHRRPDLLGELHAARALRALRVRRRDLRRVDRRRRRRLAVDARPHRAREPRVRRRAVRTSSAPSLSGRLPARAASSRASGRSAAAAARSSRPTARISPGRSTTRRESSTPSSIRRCCSPSGSASTRSATTAGRTCSQLSSSRAPMRRRVHVLPRDLPVPDREDVDAVPLERSPSFVDVQRPFAHGEVVAGLQATAS